MTKTQKKVGTVAIYVLLIGVAVFFYEQHKQAIVSSAKTIINNVKPCSLPLTYSIGSFDTQFGLSRKELLSDVDLAASKWDAVAKKKLFVDVSNNPTAISDIKINLVYDYRQITTDKLDDLSGTIDDIRARYDALKAQFNSLKSSYETKKAYLQKQIAVYQASPDKTQAMAQEIRSLQDDLNNTVDEINSIVPQLNSLAKRLNTTVDTYNSVGTATGREFDEGNYVSDGTGAEINIYQFNDNKKLTRLLEHELGHAIGLEHVENSNAIMYRLNKSTSEELTQDDINALKAQCGLK